MAQPPVSQADDEVIGSKSIVKKSELIRIVVQTLYSLTYKNLAERLEEESGILLHSHLISLLMEQITGGEWNESIATLRNIGLTDSDKMALMSILILEQRFFELLDDNKIMEALMTIRTDIAPLCNEAGRLYNLCSFIVLPLKYQQFREPVLESRKKLQKKLQSLLPPAVMIPENRLVKLLEQSFNSQRNACKFHNSWMDDVSLFSDHQCGREVIPSQTLQILREHKDEVWFLKFSRSGKYLASSSRDCGMIIWEVLATGRVSVMHRLSGLKSPVCSVLWMKNDLQVLTHGLDGNIVKWDILSGERVGIDKWIDMKKLTISKSMATSLKWSSNHIAATYKDTIALFDQDSSPVGVLDILMPGSVDSESVEFNQEIHEDHPIMSYSFSARTKFLLVSLLNQELHLWNISADPMLVATYEGHKCSRFVVGACFGGLDDVFIASGSEDSQVYIWHRDSGKLMDKLPGHSGVVNSVSWNPANPHMLASASDDHTIRIWGLNLAD